MIKAIQVPDITPELKAELAAEYERTPGAVLALGDELKVEPD